MSLIVALLQPQPEPPYNKQMIRSEDVQLARAEVTEQQQVFNPA